MIWAPGWPQLLLPNPFPARHGIVLDSWLPVPSGAAGPHHSLTLCSSYSFFLLFPSPINCLRKVWLMNSGMAYWQVEIKPHCCSSRLISQILVVERLIALWLVMSYTTSPRRRVMYYYRLSHELSAKRFLKFEFFKTRVPNSNKHGAFLPGTFATLLVHLGHYFFHIFWIYSCLHVQFFQRRRVLQNSSLFQLTVLFVSSQWCDQPSIYKGGVVNAEFFKGPIKCRGLPVQSNEAQSCLSPCHVEIVVNLKKFQGQEMYIICGSFWSNSDLEVHLLDSACGSGKSSESSFSLYCNTYSYVSPHQLEVVL